MNGINSLVKVSNAQLNRELSLTLRWILKSFAVNNNLGSSMYQHFLGYWSQPYPETTGYLIPSLLKAFQITGIKDYSELAIKQLDYFKTIACEDGSFLSKPSTGEIYFFDNAQILLGLTALYQHNKACVDPDVLYRLYNWLIEQIDATGTQVSNNYRNQQTPSYYSRACWPILQFEKSFTLKHNHKTLKLLDTLWQKRKNNAYIIDAGFDNNEFVLTHLLTYCYRGFYESFQLLGDDARVEELIGLLKRFKKHTTHEDRSILYGAYNSSWQSDNSFVCSTGNAQLALLILIINKSKHSDDLLLWCEDLLRPLLDEKKKIIHRHTGALPSSIPVWGKYQRFRYTNWTQKFYCDLIMALICGE